MKLKSLNQFEKLNDQDFQFIIGGNLAADSALWQDSSSRDSKKYDTGGNSKKHDKGVAMQFVD